MKQYYKGFSYEKNKQTGEWYITGTTNGRNLIEVFMRGTVREVKQEIDKSFKNN